MSESQLDNKGVVVSNTDLGGLIIEDCRNYESLDQKTFDARLQSNLCNVYHQLFERKKEQRLKEGGEDGEILEYTKSKWSVKLPAPMVVLPRAQPPPKAAPLTKWEKFRLEKGMPAKEKRSRMVWSEAAKDWVPRWGHNSAAH